MISIWTSANHLEELILSLLLTTQGTFGDSIDTHQTLHNVKLNIWST